MKISSKGAITLTNIRANDNGGVGTLLDNKLAGGTAGVTINAGSGKGNEFQGNKLGGLIVHSNGAVTLTNIYSANNGMDSTELNGDFSITTHLLFEPTRNFELAGLVIYQDKNNFFQFGRAYCDLTGPCSGNALYFDYANDVNPFGENYDTAITSTSEVYLRLTRDGQTITGWYSEDNATWVSIGSHIMASDFQVNGVGLTSAQDFYREELVAQTPADFDFFDLSSPATHDSFTDNFSQNWLWVNENGSNWNLSENPGYLRIYASQSQTGGENLLVLPTTAGYGLYIDNIGGTGAVSLKQVGGWGVRDAWAEGNVFSNNSAGGLNILTKGAVTVAFFQARDNWNTGIYIDADSGIGAVTLTGMGNNWDNLAYNWGDGLDIYAKGNISVSMVNSLNNDGYGAWLDNYASGYGTGNVTLTDAWFDRNGWSGLDLQTKGTVSWTNGSANDNFDYGAHIIGQGAGKAITIKNVYTNDNGETGMYVRGMGVVTMTEVEGANNSANNYTIAYGEWWTDNMNPEQMWWFEGDENDEVFIEVDVPSDRFTPSIWIYTPDGGFVDWVEGTNGSVSYNFALPQSGWYRVYVGTDNNDCNCWGYDLKLYTDMIPEATVVTDESLASGIDVDNRGGTGAVSISNSWNRWLGNNSANGVVVNSYGAVTLKGMDLNDSGLGGAVINNQNVSLTGAPGVTLTNVNFYNNNQTAAEIRTEGAVSVTNSDQSANSSTGFDIDNTFGTALSAITFTNVGLHNWGTASAGMVLRSDGAVTLTNVSSNGNADNGIDIDADGAVKFTEVNGYGNLGYGAYVITLSTFTVVGSSNNSTWFTNNLNDGLYVDAVGAISLTKVYTGENGFDRDTGDYTESANGIRLISSNTLGTAPISLTDVTSNHNTADGLRIETLGAVTFNTLTTKDNTQYGIYIDQDALDSTKAITLNLVTVENNGFDSGYTNGWDGLYVIGKGSITVNTLRVVNNAGIGAVLINDDGTGSVTLLNTLGNKYNVVIGNGRGYNGDQQRTGMFISSKGAVTINQLETIYNSGDGLVVYNDTTAVIKPAVKLTNVISRFNLVGMYVYSTGVVTIDKSWATDNGQDGISVHTNNHVNILNTASLMNNWTGIWVESDSGKWKLTLTGSAWFGNLRNDPDPADRNLLLWGDWDPIVY